MPLSNITNTNIRNLLYFLIPVHIYISTSLAMSISAWEAKLVIKCHIPLLITKPHSPRKCVLLAINFLKTSTLYSENSQTFCHSAFIFEGEVGTFVWSQTRKGNQRSKGLHRLTGQSPLPWQPWALRSHSHQWKDAPISNPWLPFLLHLIGAQTPSPHNTVLWRPFHDSNFLYSKSRRVTWRWRQRDFWITN